MKYLIFLAIMTTSALSFAQTAKLTDAECDDAAEILRENFYKSQMVNPNSDYEKVLPSPYQNRLTYEANLRSFYPLISPAVTLANQVIQKITLQTFADLQLASDLSGNSDLRADAIRKSYIGLNRDLSSSLHFYPTSSFPMCVNNPDRPLWWLEKNGQTCRWHGWVYFPSRPADSGYDAGIDVSLNESNNTIYIYLGFVPGANLQRHDGQGQLGGGHVMDAFASTIVTTKAFDDYGALGAYIEITPDRLLSHKAVTQADIKIEPLQIQLFNEAPTLEEYVLKNSTEGCKESRITQRLAAIVAERAARPDLERWLNNPLPKWSNNEKN